MDSSMRILIVEGSGTDSMLALKALHDNGYQQTYKRVDTPEDLLIALTGTSWDLVIVDLNIPNLSEQAILNIIKENEIKLPCLIFSEMIGDKRQIRRVMGGINDDMKQADASHFVSSIKSDYDNVLVNKLYKKIDDDNFLQQEWFRVTLSSIGDAVITTDMEGTVTFMNPVAEEITGFSEAESIGQPINQVMRIFNEITLGPAEIPVDRVINEGIVVGLANHTGLISKKGETRSIADSAAPIKNDEDTMMGVVMVFRDITESSRIEQHLARMDKLNAVGQMAAGIAHEIRNPMTTVHGFLQLLKINPDFKEYEDYFGLMINELERANSIITGFLSLAKENTIEVGDDNLNRIVQNIAPLIQAEAIVKNKFVKLELEDLPNMPLYEDEIRQIILNLVRNALDASAEGESVTIKTFIKNHKIVLAVHDAGPEISPEIMEKLGTPFFTTKEDGTGLGLTICQNIAEKHGAEIKIESDNNGSTFSVLFKLPAPPAVY